nr:N-formylglutamate amidohydrolase [Akkermansiaceae bacterium]
RGVSRPWQLGLLYNRDRRMAEVLFEILKGESGLCVGDNEPYQVGDEHDYSTPVHGEGRGLPHLALEIRQDEIAHGQGQERWARLLSDYLKRAAERLSA